MINVEQLQGINMCFASENAYMMNGEKWAKNLQIAQNVENNFYTWYDKTKTTPQKGDIIEFTDGFTVYPHAQVEDVNKDGVMYICENGSTHTDGKYFSTSGGAFSHIHASHFEYVGEETRIFWTWGCFGSGAGQALYFPITVKKFRQKNMEVKPWHEIHFCNTNCKNRGMKVQIMQDLQYIAYEFIKIKAFRAFAGYVGLTYRKDDNGRYFTDQFLRNEYFGKIKELPNGCKPIYAMSNGSMVVCYVHNEGKTITTYRPNPNAKDVYKPLEFDESSKYYGNPLGV